MDELALSNSQRQVLLDQKIDISHPGTVLSDFQMLLEAVGTEGFEAAGKHKLLPMAWINELDQRLSRPLRLELKRPQLRSHPYLQGLFLLLRASGLSRLEGCGSKARVVIDSNVVSRWNALNPTEQYFTLLDLWLVNGKPEMVGEREGRFGAYLMNCIGTWMGIPKQGLTWSADTQHHYIHGVGRDLYLIALLDLFGLLKVTFPSGPAQPWWPASLHHTPFGDAMMTLLFSEGGLAYPWVEGAEAELETAEDLTEETEPDEEVESGASFSFGYLQPLIQPYFPEWQKNLEIPAEKAREGEFVFRVSCGKSVWRQISIRAEATLEDLASWILKSVEFSNDHLYEFVIRNRFGAVERFQSPDCEGGPWASELEVGQLPLEVGESMQFHFDFGDDWRFDVKLEDVLPGAKKSKTAKILKKHGKAPEQYPDYDEY